MTLVKRSTSSESHQCWRLLVNFRSPCHSDSRSQYSQLALSQLYDCLSAIIRCCSKGKRLFVNQSRSTMLCRRSLSQDRLLYRVINLMQCLLVDLLECSSQSFVLELRKQPKVARWILHKLYCFHFSALLSVILKFIRSDIVGLVVLRCPFHSAVEEMVMGVAINLVTRSYSVQLLKFDCCN